MKKLLFPVILPMLFITLAFSGCGFTEDASKAQTYVDDFYSYLSEKDYDKAMDMVDEDSKKITPEDEWLKILTQKENLGKFIGYEKDMGFNTHYNNGVTTVVLNYTCKYEEMDVYEKFTMVKRGDVYKIMSYEYNTDKSLLSD